MNSRYKIEFSSLKSVFGKDRPPEMVKTTKTSPLLLRQELYKCAKYFQREGYSDWTHYQTHEIDYTGYLFIDQRYCHAIGGCVFRLREYNNIPQKFYTMHWIWLHPFARNKGLLSKQIPLFNEKFGYWYPETPHSDAMVAFVNKHKLVEPFTHFGLPIT